MKTLKLIIAGIILFASANTMQAQVSVNVNIGSPPAWGPVGYSAVDYYYLPDVQAYYDIRATQFIYFGGGNWIRSRNLPNQYRNYNLYNGYKVVLNDYHGSRPYSNFKTHKVKYYKGYKGKPQKSIGSNRSNNNKVYKSNGNNVHGNKGNGNKGGKGNNGNGKH
ncbi:MULTISPECIES: hypothetical protein [unclassified Flavobacterium]|uniref:hypothetical protein n=1 Tax=unclassified Flavobacterium TaxID=196869 RepID=UPI000F8294E4|nr:MULTISPECIES: hypothetical protein [unclassified Flavobacterium]RTY88653.1 hypothetical protein EKM00_00405 [Flavobacterium sp. RSP15]RTZ05853.1 hypothetical protein EKM03_08580 [Flavobacterium sp. GSP6]